MVYFQKPARAPRPAHVCAHVYTHGHTQAHTRAYLTLAGTGEFALVDEGTVPVPVGHNQIGPNYVGHDYIRHDHDCTGHKYIAPLLTENDACTCMGMCRDMYMCVPVCFDVSIDI